MSQPTSDPNPMNWRLDVPKDRIDLYLELSNEPRSLSSEEAAKLTSIGRCLASLKNTQNT